MLYIYTGEGKGKTTAAIGSLIRAVGAGKSCAIVFFDKNEDYCSEFRVLQALGIETHIFGKNRVYDDDFRLENSEEDKSETQNALNKAKELVDKSDFLVLDEFLNCIRTGQMEFKKALELVDNFPKEKYLILTGRGLPVELETRANLISEIKKIKHPYDRGVLVEKGVDF